MDNESGCILIKFKKMPTHEEIQKFTSKFYKDNEDIFAGMEFFGFDNANTVETIKSFILSIAKDRSTD